MGPTEERSRSTALSASSVIDKRKERPEGDYQGKGSSVPNLRVHSAAILHY